MNSFQNVAALEVENQLLQSSRLRWILVASNLCHALTYTKASCEQQEIHASAIKQYNLLLEDEKSTLPSPLPPKS